jgi:hypothetical protein
MCRSPLLHFQTVFIGQTHSCEMLCASFKRAPETSNNVFPPVWLRTSWQYGHREHLLSSLRIVLIFIPVRANLDAGLLLPRRMPQEAFWAPCPPLRPQKVALCPGGAAGGVLGASGRCRDVRYRGWGWVTPTAGEVGLLPQSRPKPHSPAGKHPDGTTR